jgi:hypothetical protein
MHPRETIAAFDAFLAGRDLSLDAVVVGGSALGLLGITSRQTRDCDVLAPDLPESVLAAAREFAATRRAGGDPLSDEWLNNGPSSLARALPPGWTDRLQIAFAGESLTLRCLGRADLLRSKLFALCDRGIDLPDCLALAPTDGELNEIEGWVAAQDTNPDWPEHVRAVIADLGKRLGHGA